VAVLGSRQTTRQLTDRCYPISILEQSCNSPVQVPLARPPVCTRWPPLRLSGLLRPLPTVADSDPLIRKGSGAWDLTSDARIGLLLFRSWSLTSFPIRQETHYDVPTGWLCNLSIAHIHTPYCSLLRGRGLLGLRRLPTISTHFSQIAYSQQAPFPADWWLPLAANLEPLPPFPLPLLLIRSLLLAQMRNHTCFTRPSVRLLHA